MPRLVCDPGLSRKCKPAHSAAPCLQLRLKAVLHNMLGSRLERLCRRLLQAHRSEWRMGFRNIENRTRSGKLRQRQGRRHDGSSASLGLGRAAGTASPPWACSATAHGVEHHAVQHGAAVGCPAGSQGRTSRQRCAGGTACRLTIPGMPARQAPAGALARLPGKEAACTGGTSCTACCQHAYRKGRVGMIRSRWNVSPGR